MTASDLSFGKTNCTTVMPLLVTEPLMVSKTVGEVGINFRPSFMLAASVALLMMLLDAALSRRIGCFFPYKQATNRRLTEQRMPKEEISIAMDSRVLDMLTVIKLMTISAQRELTT